MLKSVLVNRMCYDKIKELKFIVVLSKFVIIKHTYISNVYCIEWLLKHCQNKSYQDSLAQVTN